MVHQSYKFHVFIHRGAMCQNSTTYKFRECTKSRGARPSKKGSGETAENVWRCRNLRSSNQIALFQFWWCHTGLSKGSRLVLITSGKFIAKTVAKMDSKTNHFYWIGLNTVQSKFLTENFFYTVCDQTLFLRVGRRETGMHLIPDTNLSHLKLTPLQN